MVMQNACNISVNQSTGNLPQMGEVVKSYFVNLVFNLVTKTNDFGSVFETMTPISCQGSIQPFAWRDLLIKDVGERAWTWFWLHTDTTLSMKVDDVVEYLGVKYRVKALKPYDAYGYREYQIIQDFKGDGPAVAP
jgi:hypothetical protein